MSGTMTGDGITGFCMFLRYFDAKVPVKWSSMDAAYSIDAPSLIVCGSHIRDEGDGIILPRESWSERP